MQGADLAETQLPGADLRGISLWQSALNSETNLGLADLRAASWRPIDKDETQLFQNIMQLLQNGEIPHERSDRGLKARLERLERLIAPGERSDDPPEFALDGLLLVDDVEDPRWRRLARARLTADERAYDEALIPFLADLAGSDPHVARGLFLEGFYGNIFRRAETYYGNNRRLGRARLARGLLDRAGPALPEDVRQRLSKKIASQPETKD